MIKNIRPGIDYSHWGISIPRMFLGNLSHFISDQSLMHSDVTVFVDPTDSHQDIAELFRPDRFTILRNIPWSRFLKGVNTTFAKSDECQILNSILPAKKRILDPRLGKGMASASTKPPKAEEYFSVFVQATAHRFAKKPDNSKPEVLLQKSRTGSICALTTINVTAGMRFYSMFLGEAVTQRIVLQR